MDAGALDESLLAAATLGDKPPSAAMAAPVADNFLLADVTATALDASASAAASSISVLSGSVMARLLSCLAVHVGSNAAAMHDRISIKLAVAPLQRVDLQATAGRCWLNGQASATTPQARCC